jgi:hypothetical protein
VLQCSYRTTPQWAWRISPRFGRLSVSRLVPRRSGSSGTGTKSGHSNPRATGWWEARLAATASIRGRLRQVVSAQSEWTTKREPDFTPLLLPAATSWLACKTKPLHRNTARGWPVPSGASRSRAGRCARAVGCAPRYGAQATPRAATPLQTATSSPSVGRRPGLGDLLVPDCPALVRLSAAAKRWACWEQAPRTYRGRTRPRPFSLRPARVSKPQGEPLVAVARNRPFLVLALGLPCKYCPAVGVPLICGVIRSRTTFWGHNSGTASTTRSGSLHSTTLPAARRTLKARR